MRILIVGGYGTFGGRLVELVEDDQRLTLIVSGRSLAQAKAFCASRGRATAHLVPAAFDRDKATAEELHRLQPDLLVDASGPFQAYGPQPYRLLELCIGCKVNYADLADGAAFVAGVGRFDAAAKSAGVFVLSGVSSFPVLTAAVFSSWLSRAIQGRGRSEWLACERFGPVQLDAALLVENSALRYVVRHWSFLGIPLPLAWGPKTKALESVENGQFKFDVTICHPLVGLIVQYVGTLSAES